MHNAIPVEVHDSQTVSGGMIMREFVEKASCSKRPGVEDGESDRYRLR